MNATRRTFVFGALASTIVTASAPPRSGFGTSRRPRVRIGMSPTNCDIATLVASERGLFAAEGIDAHLVPLPNATAGIDAVADGRIDAVVGPVYAYLEPIAQGLDIRLTAGLHGGCLRPVAAVRSRIRKVADLRGATIATPDADGPAADFLASLLVREGIDAKTSVTWRVTTGERLRGVLDAGHADVVLAADPLTYDLMLERRAVQITDDLAAGIFYCDRGISHTHQCFIALHGSLARRQPRIAAAITRALMAATRWVGHQPLAAAALLDRHVERDTDVRTSAGLLSAYGWHPSADIALEEIELIARDFVRAGRLPHRIDPEQLAEKAYVDIFAAADA